LIDIHSHVLYGLDDGARTLEDSVAMLRMAAEHGTTELVATPHANPTYRFEPERIA
jgi:protein-tyrosine phosphatase